MIRKLTESENKFIKSGVKMATGGDVAYRISALTATGLLVSATIADLVTAIPFAGSVLGWLYWAIMTFVFWKLGLGWVSWRRLVPSIISTVAEFIPIAQEFPTIIAGMAIIIVLTRIEDKMQLNSLPSKKKPKPFNAEKGIRRPNRPAAPKKQEEQEDFPLDEGEFA